MGLLEGHRALVTGGGSGIGRATARRFAEEGATVGILDVHADNAARVAEEVGGPAYVVDVRDPAAVTAAVDEAAGELGGLSLLFNNAGVGWASPIADTDDDTWNRVVRICLDGSFHVLRAAIPHLLAAGSGAVVNTSSISGLRPAAGEAPYAAAKAGISALTASAALELAPLVRVNAVAPGTVRTGLTDPVLSTAAAEKWHLDKIPLQRIGAPEELADVVVFLCSDLARYITGQTIVADGGLTLHGSGVDGLLDQVKIWFGL